MRIYLILFVLFLFSKCHHNEEKKLVWFMLDNASSTKTKVDINVFVDGEKIVADTFKYSDIQPSETPYSQSLSKGKHKLVVEASNGKLRKETSFDLGDTLSNIFISYMYHYPTPDEIKAYQYENFLIRGDSLKGFDTSKYIVKEQIGIHFMKGKIVPM